ncbi:coenzyme F420 hydrogenase [Clostridiaceae bacterium]|nr:coenzyme F420 hydrogenase [Clostridiaceae bacterium]
MSTQRNHPVYYRSSKDKEPAVYAVKHRNSEVRSASRSGGVFTAISDDFLLHGGVVYGCVLKNNDKAEHCRAETAAERDRMRGSKYIQSDMGDVFPQIRQDLESGRKVLFSGTSCQAAGLKGYLGKDYPNLFCVDIVCHGVPSPAVWREYLKWQSKKGKSEISSVDFRNKRDFGWAEHIETIWLKNGKRVDSKVFKNLFFSHCILRPACYKCPYKDVIHPGDITIADYWGIDVAAPGFNDNRGVSLVFLNNASGRALFEEIADKIECIPTKIEDSMQMSLSEPYPVPKNREKFWSDYRKHNFGYIARRYGGTGPAAASRKWLSNIKKRLIHVLHGDNG